MSSSPSDKMIAQFQTLEELQAFAKAQQTTLINQQKKLKVAEDEIKHLKKLLESTVPVINPNTKVDFASNDEETISRQQLFILKGISNERELTLEETKRVEIFSKILNNLKNDKTKDLNGNSRELTNEQLMAAATSSEDDDGRSDNQH